MCIGNLESSISKDGNALSIKGYSIIRVDHPSNTEKGVACIYYNEAISVTQCLACEFVIENKKDHLIILYHSSSQNQGEFEHFLR